MQTAVVQSQYEHFPFPPLEMGALTEVTPPPADASFAHWYTRRHWPQQALRILDAGCGTGFSTLKLGEANPGAEILALDLSQQALQIAAQRLQEAGWQLQDAHWQHSQHAGCIRLLQADLQNLPELGQFDYLHCSGVIHHVPDPLRALCHLRRCLAQNGVAYLMVYSGASRQIIAQIQTVLKELWKNTDDWHEGLMLCRSLFRDLPERHPFKQHYLQTYAVVSQVLGPEFAQADAFLVDTYLQRCEHRWSQPEWFQLLREAGFAPTRWLDESSWQISQWLPGLPDYLKHLSVETQWKIADQLRPNHHFALYALPEAQAVPALQPVISTACPQIVYGVQLLVSSDEQWLDNGRGTRIRLDSACALAWQILQVKPQALSWQQLWKGVQAQFPDYAAADFWHFVSLLQRHELVGLI